MGETGGLALSSALALNSTLKVLVIADNLIGSENMKIISGRLNGNISNICTSVKPHELNMPVHYDPRRFNQAGLREIVSEQAAKMERRHKKAVTRKTLCEDGDVDDCIRGKESGEGVE